MDPVFFSNPAAWRAWLQKNHARQSELLVGFYKKASAKPSITWPESVDAALCFGWIDGVRRRIDDESYTIRFTPRKARSIWSAVNIKRVEELTAAGLLHASGTAAYAARSEDRSRIYAFEQSSVEFDTGQLTRFQVHPAAWKFFQSRSASYQKKAKWWVISAKQTATRETRLTALIEGCDAGREIR